MTLNDTAIVCLTGASLLLSYCSLKNSRTENQNAELLKVMGELKSSRWIAVMVSVIAAAVSIMAAAMNSHSDKDDSWVLSLSGSLVLLIFFWRSFYGIRFENEFLRYGLKCRKQVSYSEIKELERVSTGKDATFVVILRSGARISIGSNLPCESLLIEELQRRSGCKFFRSVWGRRKI